MSDLPPDRPSQPPVAASDRGTPGCIIAIVASIAVFAVLVTLASWWVMSEIRAVNLIVVNASSTPIDSVTLSAGDEAFIIADVPIGEERAESWQLNESLGGVDLKVRTPRGEAGRQAGYLLDDDGPYEFRVTVRDDGITVVRDNNDPPVTWQLGPATRATE